MEVQSHFAVQHTKPIWKIHNHIMYYILLFQLTCSLICGLHIVIIMNNNVLINRE